MEKRGVEKAQCVVAYHYDKAQETTYTPQLFGGFLHDVEAAMQSLTAREQKRWQQKLESQEHDLKLRYQRYRAEEIEKVRAMFDGETLSSMRPPSGKTSLVREHF